MVKGGISFTATGNKLEVTASHPNFLSQAPLCLFPRCPIDPWVLAMKSMLAGALFSAARFMSCHPGHRHNYPAQATPTGGQGDDRRVEN